MNTSLEHLPEHKDFGHTAIRIGDKVYGYYPTGGDGQGFGWKDLLRSKGDMRIITIPEFGK